MQRGGDGDDGERHRDSSSSHDDVLAAARAAARAHTYDAAHTRILVVTGVHAGIPQAVVDGAISTCGDASSDALTRAITAVCERTRAKRTRVDDASMDAEATTVAIADEVESHMTRLNSRVPQPVCIQTASPVHTAAAGYRRNVWIEYACEEDALIAHALLQHTRVDMPAHFDATANSKETKRVITALGDVHFKADLDAVTLPPRDAALTTALARAPQYITALTQAEALRLPVLRVPEPSRASAATHPRGCFISASLHTHSGASAPGGAAKRSQATIAQALYPYGTGHTHTIASWACEAVYARAHLTDALALVAALDAANGITSAASSDSSPLFAALHDDGSAGSRFTTLEALDAAIFYLRHVHLYDFYSGIQCDSPGDLRQCVGDGYKRASTCDHSHADVHTHAASTGTVKQADDAVATLPVVEDAAAAPGTNGDAGDAEVAEGAPAAPADAAGHDAGDAADDGIEEEPQAATAVQQPAATSSTAAKEEWSFTRMSENAQAAAQSWARRLNDRVRARIAAAHAQLAYDAAVVAAPADANITAAATAAPLVPVYVKDVQPKRLDLIHALSKRLEAIETALLASIPETAALLPLYTAQLVITHPTSTAHADDASRMIAYVHDADAATVDARTHCRVCSKVFKAPVFAVKHLHNKHPAEVQRALSRTRACVAAVLRVALTTPLMLRMYYDDARRPMPYVDPLEIAALADSAGRERAQATASHAHAVRGLLGAAPSHMPVGAFTRAGGGVLGIAPTGGPLAPLHKSPKQPAVPRYRDTDAPTSSPPIVPALPKPDYGANIVSYEDI